MTPYLYPKVRHKRSEDPPLFSHYRLYKKTLQIEFKRKCVYCQQSDSAAPNEHSFGVDHYKPQSIFPASSLDYNNLFYCCNACNARKGNYWPAVADLAKRFIPNPCDYVMFDHLRFKGPEVEPRSEAGIFATERLDLNDPQTLQYREHVNFTIGIYEDRLSEATHLLEKLLAAIAIGKIHQSEVQQEKAELASDIANLKGGLDRFMGTAPTVA